MMVIVPRVQKAKEMFFVLFFTVNELQKHQVEIVFSLCHPKITEIIMTFQFAKNKIPPFLENVLPASTKAESLPVVLNTLLKN